MDFPELEKKIIKFWRSSNAFERSIEKRSKARDFIFYEGPPTANGKPGFHHVLGRAFKDVILRYKTMQGYKVQRRAGWDTHGLPVELEVEKELGLKNKKDIEKYGIEKFNEKCRQSTWKYKKEWEDLTERMGFWIDMKDPYITYDPLYIESLWNIIKQAWDKKLLYEGYKVIPRCSRCGTGLSSHEVALGYKDVTEQSVFVKFKIKKANKLMKLKSNESVYFLAWTTTPWTLPGNVALAVGPNIEYSIVKQNHSSTDLEDSGQDEYYILAKERLNILEDEYKVLKEIRGKDLIDIKYEPLFDSLKDARGNKYLVVPADFVNTKEGTGIVHTAVMYGEDDYELGKLFNLPKVHTVDEEGKFNELVPEFRGKFVKNADVGIIEYLKLKKLLYKTLKYKHSYPFCWRCSTPLIYYAMHSWFLRMSKLREELILANKKINWVPEYIKEGRFGQWIYEVKDWAFSRTRYWGTPLPVWRCDECYHVEVVGSRQDIAKFTKGKNKYILMRHGEAESNIKQVLNGAYPEKKKDHLTKKGIAQVKKSAQKLKKENKIDLIVASPKTRTKETAEIVSRELNIEIVYDKRILEINFGIFENKSYKNYNNSFVDRKERFTKNSYKRETLTEVKMRTVNLMKELEAKYSGKRILLVAHMDTLWMLKSAMLGLTNDEIIERGRELTLRNAQTEEISYANFPYDKEGDLNFHRPYVDKITFPCTICNDEKSVMHRVEDLVDVWFDSGSMPFAQAHWPFSFESGDKKLLYPADYIVEGIDQTRGWFYTLLAVSAIIDKAPPYENVISLGLVLDEKGKKMSKSKGNTVDPFELGEKYGMDAVRWYFFTVNHPGAVKRFSEKDVRERLYKFISTFFNSYIFLTMYWKNKKAPKSFNIKTSSNILDKWIYVNFKKLVFDVEIYMNNYNILDASRAIDEFTINNLSNWYIRRSRERFQRPSSLSDKNDAIKTLSFILSELSKLSAPFVPFIAEFIWQSVNSIRKNSVHWEDYPSFNKLTSAENKILKDMETIRGLAQEGLRLRIKGGFRVRQPLKSFAISKKLSEELKDILKEELNIKEVVDVSSIKNAQNKEWLFSDSQYGKLALKITLSEALLLEGQAREFVRNIQQLRKSLKLKPQDKIRIYYSLPRALHGKLLEWEKKIAQDTNSIEVIEKEINGKVYDATSEFKWDAKYKVKIVVRRL